MTIGKGMLVTADDAALVQWNGEAGRFLLGKKDTGGLLTLAEIITEVGSGPPLHVHEVEDEAFVVLEGRYEVELDGVQYEAGPGMAVYSPRGVSHRFRNISDAPARILLVVTPGGVEEFFIGLGEMFADGRRPGGAEVLELAARHRIRGFEAGPPPGGVWESAPVPGRSTAVFRRESPSGR